MKAIILAGGMAKRLRPITDDLPKCLLNVGGQTIIDRQIEDLYALGAEQVVVVTGFKSELLEQHLHLHHPGKNITTIKNEEYESTKPAYGLWCAREHLGESTVLYLNGDLVCDQTVLRDLLASRRGSATAVSRGPWDQEQVKVEVGADRSVKALGKWIEAPQSYGEFVGATKLSPEFGRALKKVLERLWHDGSLADKFAADALNETLPEASGALYLMDVTNYKTIEVDTIADFKAAGEMWRLKATSKLRTALKIGGARLVHTLSFLFPRFATKVVFVGWHKNDQREVFADNAKYLFLHLHNTRKGSLRPIWIAKDRLLQNILAKRGFEAHYTYSPAGMWHALTAGTTVVDAHMYRDNWQFSGRSRIIQLWHGKGMKKSGLKPNGGRGFSRLISPELFQKFYRFIASSPYTAELMADIFKDAPHKVLVTGLPRNDIFFRGIAGAEIDIDEGYRDAIADFKKEGAKKIIAYMPTFRRNSSNPLDQLNLIELNEALGKHGFRMLITLHPKFSAINYRSASTLQNIKILNAGYDIYPLFKDIDLLITDYSSLYVDYLLLNRPIIFYTYDRESYERETGLYEDFDELTPGPHVATFEELLETLFSYDDARWQNARGAATAKLHAFTDGGSSERVAQEIIGR